MARRINGRSTGSAADRFWRRLSRFADRGVLWLTVSAVLVALGRPRAAARGLLALAVASITANVVGKQLIGGDRPALASIPVARRLHRSPTSPSFPSGHTASAVAFASGVALDTPVAGAAVAPLAAGVAYSRLHTGAHWASDVAGGAVIGAGAALAVTAVLRTLDRSGPPRREPPTAKDISLPALVDGDGAFIVVNPGSGRGLGRPDPTPFLAERLPKAAVHVLREGDDIPTLIRDALGSARPPSVLGVCGGDGSVSAVAHQARLAGLPLFVMPGGTFNHFAKAAAVDGMDRAVHALRSGTGRAVDVAELRRGAEETLTVLNTASIGLYPAFVEEREKHEKRLGKPIAALIAAIRVVRRSDPVEVEIDGRRQKVWSVFVGVGRYYPVTAAPIERRRLDDALLDVRILASERTPRTRGALALVLGGRGDALVSRLPFLQGSPVTRSFTATRLRLAALGEDPGFAHDGETVPGTSGTAPTLEFELLPGALRVYGPPNSVTNRAAPPRG